MWTGGGLSKRGTALPRTQIAPSSLATADQEGISLEGSRLSSRPQVPGAGIGGRTRGGRGHAARRSSTALIQTMGRGGSGSGRLSHGRSGSIVPMSFGGGSSIGGSHSKGGGSIAGSRRLSTILSPRARGQAPRSRGSGSHAGSSVAGGSTRGPASPRRHSRAVSSVGIDSIIEESGSIRGGKSAGSGSMADTASVASEAVVHGGAGDDPNGEAASRVSTRSLRVLSSPLRVDWTRSCQPLPLGMHDAGTQASGAIGRRQVHLGWLKSLPYHSIAEFSCVAGTDLPKLCDAVVGNVSRVQPVASAACAAASSSQEDAMDSASVAYRCPDGSLLVVQIDRYDRTNQGKSKPLLNASNAFRLLSSQGGLSDLDGIASRLKSERASASDRKQSVESHSDADELDFLASAGKPA